MFELKEDIYSARMKELPDLQHLPGKSPAEKLLTLLKFISRWDEFPEERKEEAMRIFMKWLGYLYLDYFQYQLEEASEIGLDYEYYLYELSLKPIAKYYVAPFVYSIDHAFGEYFWREACEIRTHMEAFQDMFGSYIEKFKPDDWALEHLYEYLEAYRNSPGLLKKEEIPKNTPKSHWWWFFEWPDGKKPFFT